MIFFANGPGFHVNKDGAGDGRFSCQDESQSKFTA